MLSDFQATMSSVLCHAASRVYFEHILSRTIKLHQYNISTLVWAIVGLCTIQFLRSFAFTSRRFFNDNYPPGPPALPIFGNLFQLTLDAWRPFTDWKSKYGPLIYLNVAGQPMIVINSHKVAADLLDRRANIYSDRPHLIVASDFMTGGNFFPFMPHGHMWRRLRRAAHDAIGHKAADIYHQTQVIEAILLTDGLLQNPSSWGNHVLRATASTISTLLYDTPALDHVNDPSVAHLNDFVERVAIALHPGAYLVEFFTWMKYVPSWMATWKRDALEWYEKDSTMFLRLYDDVCQRLASGDQRPSVSSSLAQRSDKYGLNAKESAWLTAALYSAGLESSAAVLSWFLLAMVAFPDVQKKAQSELDEVVGRGKLPTFADYGHLPYIRALVKETLRWKPVTPLGISHCLIQDDTYEGYHIPKGAIVISNIWAMNHDPEIYGADAHEFNPSRYLDSEGNLKPALINTKEESHVSYGFGHRICPGRHIANNSTFMDIATILWALTIEPARDASGKYIMPDVDGYVNTGVLLKPMPFDCITKPRFADADAILAQAKEDIGYGHLVWKY